MKKRKEAMKWWDKTPVFDRLLLCSEKFGAGRKHTVLKTKEIVELYEDYLRKSKYIE